MECDPLSATALMEHVRVLADEIGPRPAGHPAELRARRYIRETLTEAGYLETESLSFEAPDTWAYALVLPAVFGLTASLLGAFGGRRGKWLGGLAALGCAASMWEAARCGRQAFAFMAPRRPSATLVARILPVKSTRRRVVLLGHTDSNKDRISFNPTLKKSLLGISTSVVGSLLGTGAAQLGEVWGSKGASTFWKASWASCALLTALSLWDERGSFVPGANDNATAVACLLGLAAQLRETPLQYTEVWLAFTGAEEVGCMGAHALLDQCGEELRDAWFLDFEMVGTERVAYVQRHTGFSLLSGYTPDPESLAWAQETAARHPEMGVEGVNLVIGEEVGALRSRGYRGVCLAGVGPDGWLAQWHQADDVTEKLVPDGVEKAARFALAMLQVMDERAGG